jgi:hypothetical protein
MKIVTSGSVYEVDQKESRIRRLEGKLDPTKRVGNDGEWKQYHSLSDIKIGQCILIIWNEDIEPLAIEGTSPGTMTSPVVEIIDDAN